MPMIHAEGLTKRFGDLTAVDQVSLDVAEGEVFGLLGPNGAGKTTTVRMLCGLISKTNGSAVVAGCEVGKEADAIRLRAQIGGLTENVGLYDGASAYENLEYFGQLHGLEPGALRSNIERLLRMMDLWERRESSVATFSKGMRQKLAIARALVHDPVLLFLDEPTANLDPEASKMVRDLILQLRREKRTIFLNTHNLDEAQRVCDRVGVLKTRLLTVGRPSDLEAQLVGRRTIVGLQEVTEGLAEAVRRLLPSRRIEMIEGGLSIEVQNPKEENPEIVRAIVSSGGKIQAVSQSTASLEDVYLALVQGRTASA